MPARAADRDDDSKKRKRKRRETETEKRPTNGRASKGKRQNNHDSLRPGRVAPDSDLDAAGACAARLPVVLQGGVLDHVAEDLDGAFLDDPGFTLSPFERFSYQVLFCGIKYVDISLCDTRLIAGNRSSTQPRAARATCLLLEDTTMQTRQTISGAAFISLVRAASILSCPLVYTKQGFTSRLLPASEDSSLPEMYNLGLVR